MSPLARGAVRKNALLKNIVADYLLVLCRYHRIKKITKLLGLSLTHCSKCDKCFTERFCKCEQGKQ